ncbi:MAG TPA: low temperature requirement protein A [Steroidobacteraceae bacterium]|jgi:low temperature requirement protein LtrA|nr:low temperature requirement protein A [Steroidobacteraceae bacterium]
MSATRAGHGPLLRERDAHEHGRVTYVELFFDLIFVFAVTQLSHLLMRQLSPLGAVQALVLLLAVWWAWIDTSWVTNWLDPQRSAVRLMLFVLMFAGLLLSASIPGAFGAQALLFAATYAFIQIGRSSFMLWALRAHERRNFRNFQRIACWHALIGALWIAGVLLQGGPRLAAWIVAVTLECIAPSIGFVVPGLGRSRTEDWNVDGAHLAERCALFVIIALGESVLVTGATAAAERATPATVLAFSVAFLGTVAMWWIYFNIGAERGSEQIASAADPGRLARAAYTYVHVLIVAGIVVVAVADEILLTRPSAHAALRDAVTLIAGPVLYLAGNLLFKRASARRLPLSHLAGLALLAVLAVPSLLAAAAGSAPLPPLMIGAATTGVLIVVAAWETLSLRPAAARAERAGR